MEFALIAPLMIFILFAILDLSRIYTTMMSVESAAREAADYGTSYGAAKWAGGPSTDAWVDDMQRRACVAASDLPDFEWTDTDSDGVIDAGEDCTNPTFALCLRKVPAGPCLDSTSTGYDCDEVPPENNDPINDPPCMVTVTMSHVFHLFVPFQIEFFGVKLGLPVSIAFDRDSTYVMTDIVVEESPSPGP